MQIRNGQYLSLEQMQDTLSKKNTGKLQVFSSSQTSFQDILKDKQNAVAEPVSLKFSKHAANRLSDRNISLTDNQMERLNMGAVRADEKGIRESLVLVDSLAFIVNVPNKTVVTAMDQTQAGENIYTNIDGAVIINNVAGPYGSDSS